MVKGKKCCYCGGESGFANLLAVFAEASKYVTKPVITDKEYPAFKNGTLPQAHYKAKLQRQKGPRPLVELL